MILPAQIEAPPLSLLIPLIAPLIFKSIPPLSNVTPLPTKNKLY